MRKANVRAFDPHLCHLKRTLRSEVSEVLHGLLFRFAIPAKAFRAQRLGDRELRTDFSNENVFGKSQLWGIPIPLVALTVVGVFFLFLFFSFCFSLSFSFSFSFSLSFSVYIYFSFSSLSLSFYLFLYLEKL